MAESTSKSISSAEAVMLGALASGVNGPTWVILKFTFMMLAICLIAMLSLAFVSSEFMIVGHIVLLVIMGSVLFVLLHSTEEMVPEPDMIFVQIFSAYRPGIRGSTNRRDGYITK